MYYALICDIIKSKRIENRQVFQDNLNKHLEKINIDYDLELASNFTITLGDEFQALFLRPDKIFEILLKIELAMEPVKVRFAIGIGSITTAIAKEKALGSDGPAWWNAREIIKEIKSTHERGLKERSNIRISGLENLSIQELINITLTLLYDIKENWTSSQKTIVKYIVENYGLNKKFIQNEVAMNLKLSSPDVNKKLKLSKFYDFALCIDKITKVLNK